MHASLRFPILVPLLGFCALVAPSDARQERGEVLLIEEDLDGSLRQSPLAEDVVANVAERAGTFLRYQGIAPPAALDRMADGWAELELGWGQRLRGLLDGGRGEDLAVRLSAGLVLDVPLDELRALVLPARAAVEGGVELSAPVSGDRLYRRRGNGIDRIDGLVQGFSAAGLDFESELGARSYPWSEVAALFVEPLAEEPPQGIAFAVDLHGGSRIRGSIDELSRSGVRMRWGVLGRELEVPSELVLEIAREDGRWTSLSELAPHELGPLGPFGDELGMRWPPRMDRAQSGGPLRAGGREWARGIGVHAPSRITWELGGAYASLRLAAGIDDEVSRAARGGSVIFRVELDGKLAYESPLARAGEMLPIGPIDLAGVDQLVLAVDPGTDSFVLDRADWLRPILVRR